MAKRLHTFMGDTPAQALKKAQDTFGSEILLVENKEIRKKSLTQPGLYEIVIAVDDDIAQAPQASTQATMADSINTPPSPAKDIPSPNSVQKKLDEIAEKKMAQKRKDAQKPKIYDEVTLQLSDADRKSVV